MLRLLREQWLKRHGACDLRLARPGVVAGHRVEAGVGDIVWRRPRARAPEGAHVPVQIHGGHIVDAWEHEGGDAGNVTKLRIIERYFLQ